MDGSTIESLSQRVAALERANRRWRLGAAAALAAALGGWALAGRAAAEGGRNVETEKVVMRDASGKIGAVLSMGQDGAPNLDLIDKNGKFRVRLGVTSDDGVRLVLSDAEGRGRAVLAAAPDGAPMIELRDKDGKLTFKAP